MSTLATKRVELFGVDVDALAYRVDLPAAQP